MEIRILSKKIVNFFLKKFGQVARIKTNKKIVYLTFDDGPEPGITEFITNELDKYGFHATFFCTGENAVAHPELMELLRRKGHLIGNHSWSHTKHPYLSDADEYCDDILRADSVLRTPLFRPPWGSVGWKKFLRLRSSFRFISWSLGSDDHVRREENHDWAAQVQRMTADTKPGDIILFHFSQMLSQGTTHLLPPYLQWLHEQGWVSECLPFSDKR